MIVNLGQDSYPIYIKKGILHHIHEYIQPVFKGNKIMIISDEYVYSLYGNLIIDQLSHDYDVSHICMPRGEQSKRFDVLPQIYDQLLEFKLTRKDLIIALGGGVIGDLAGFIASTYLRGVSFVQIPTSLLAQVDSSVGGKVGVDLPQGKNLVGAFKHPLMVLIDPYTLLTLEKRYISDGMAEVIKYGLIFDQEFFNQIAQYESFESLYEDIEDIIDQCVNYKRKVVEKDLYDFNNRLVLNFGHTLGHAIEQYYHYDYYRHGEAVSIGMVQITKMSELHGLTQKGTTDQIKQVCKKYHLPTQSQIHIKELKKAISLDKKNSNNQLSFVLLKQVGESFIHSTDLSFVDIVREV